MVLTLSAADAATPAVSPDLAEGPVQTWRGRSGRVSARCYQGRGRYWLDLPEVGTFGFQAGSPAVEVTAAPGADRDLVEDAFRRTVAPLALQALGFEVLHASAVLTPVGVVGFCALSGTGKSTLAHGLERRGYGVWADDAVVLEIRRGQAVAVPLPFRVRLRSASAAYFGGQVIDAPDGAAGGPVRCPEGRQPVGALFVLERHEDPTTEPTGVERLGGAGAFVALLRHAHAFSLVAPERRRRMAAHYLEVVAAVPVFALAFRAGMAGVPQLLDDIERALKGPLLG